jgi:hypothetical protein
MVVSMQRDISSPLWSYTKPSVTAVPYVTAKGEVAIPVLRLKP